MKIWERGIAPCFLLMQQCHIEKSKVRKYDRMGRLLFCICVSQALMLVVGNIVKHNHHEIKKKFPQTADLILALLPWQKSL